MSVNYTTLLHSKQSAALWRAIALRRLHAYRAAREAAKDRGDDLVGLIEPPKYQDLSAAYKDLIDEWLPENINNARSARAALDLVAAIAQDRQFVGIFEEGPIVSEEKDLADQIQLIDNLGGWINRLEIDEAVEKEREARQ